MAIDFRRGNMSKSALILLIQENPADGQPVRQALANGGDGSRVQLVTRVGTALARLAGGGVDLVILDLSRSDKLEIEDRDRFLKLRSLAPTVPFVVVHDSEDDSLIVRTVKAGGGDCLSRARCDAALSLMARSAIENRLTLNRPRLPPWLAALELRGLRVGKSRIDLRVIQGREGAAVELVARDGDAEVVVRR